MWHMCISDALVQIYLWCSCYKCKTCISLYISLMQLIHMCSCHSASEWQEHTEMYLCISLMQLIYIWHIYISDVYLWCISPVHHTSFRRGKFSTNLGPFGKIRQVQNTTSCHNSGTMKLNSIRISMVCGHAPYNYPPRNTMPKSLGTNSNPLRIFWSDTSFSPTGTA